MDRRRPRHVARELRDARLVTGGRGCWILVSAEGEALPGKGVDEWVSPRAWAALERAAERLGFATSSGPAVALSRAIVQGCLDDVLSEAIEEQETEEREAHA